MLTVFRKEMKYVISRIDACRLEARLNGVLTMDEHGNHGSYLVRSQYFDSIGDRDYNENLDGLMVRSKIRIRTYPSEHPIEDPPPKTLKLEHKCKYGSDSTKYSLSITPKEALCMENCDYDFLDRFDQGDDAEVAQNIKVKCQQELYRPAAIVSYRRKAFLYPMNDVRITFDSDLATSVSPYGLLDYSKGLFPVTTEDRVVLEVKYNGFLPQFIRNIVSSIDHNESANSKYAIIREFNY